MDDDKPTSAGHRLDHGGSIERREAAQVDDLQFVASSAASLALSSAVATIGPYATTVTSWPGRTISGPIEGRRPGRQFRPWPSTGAWARRRSPDRRIGSPAGSSSTHPDGSAQATTFSPAVCAKYDLGDSRVVLNGADPTAERDPDRRSASEARPRERLCILATWLTIWSKPGIDEAVELDLAHRAVARG